MNRKLVGPVLFVVLFLGLMPILFVSPVHADVSGIVNGGFETGSLPPWTGSGIVYSTVAHHSGSYACLLDQFSHTNIITQSSLVDVGTVTAFNLWAINVQGNDDYLNVTIGYSDASYTKTIFTVFTPLQQYLNLDILPHLSPGKTVSSITIRCDGANDRFWIDDVTLTSVPPAVVLNLVCNPTALSAWVLVDSTNETSLPTSVSVAKGSHTLEAQPTTVEGYYFSKWQVNGSDTSTSNSFTINIQGNTTATCVYLPLPSGTGNENGNSGLGSGLGLGLGLFRLSDVNLGSVGQGETRTFTMTLTSGYSTSVPSMSFSGLTSSWFTAHGFPKVVIVGTNQISVTVTVPGNAPLGPGSDVASVTSSSLLSSTAAISYTVTKPAAKSLFDWLKGLLDALNNALNNLTNIIIDHLPPFLQPVARAVHRLIGNWWLLLLLLLLILALSYYSLRKNEKRGKTR